MNYDVIIPLYNGVKWIEETIDSVLVQNTPPAEMIVGGLVHIKTSISYPKWILVLCT